MIIILLVLVVHFSPKWSVVFFHIGRWTIICNAHRYNNTDQTDQTTMMSSFPILLWAVSYVILGIALFFASLVLATKMFPPKDREHHRRKWRFSRL